MSTDETKEFDEALFNSHVNKLKDSVAKHALLYYAKKILDSDERIDTAEMQAEVYDYITFAEARGYTKTDIARHCQVSEATIDMALDMEISNRPLLLIMVIQLN